MRVHVWVEGRVQGVFFRDFTRQHARSLAVTGWVRNTPDGRVEGLFEGEPEAVAELVQQLRQGPPYSEVRGVETTHEAYRGEFEEFSVVF